jgi:hypothetical protein
MAKIADLLVQLSVDTASLRRDFTSAQRTVEDFGSGLNTAFRGIASAVGLSIGAISAHMAIDFVKSTNAAVDSLGKLSQKIGISVQDLSTMQHALKLSDVPVETFATGVGLLSKSLAGMSDELETKGAPAALQALGIKARDAAGNIRSTSDVLLDIAEKFKGFADGAGKTNLAIQLFGRSGKELIPFLNEGADGIRRMQVEAKALGLEIDGKTSAAAQQFNDDLERLKAISEGTARQFLSGLLPSLNRLAEGFTDVAKQSDVAGESLSKRFGANVGEKLESLTKKFLGFGFAINEAKVWLDLQNQKFLDFIGIADKGDQSVAELAQELHNLRRGWQEVNGVMSQTSSIATQLFGNDGQFAKGIETLNKLFPVAKPQVPKLPDLTPIKDNSNELATAAEKIDNIVDKFTRKTLDPFQEISRDYTNTIDGLAQIWAKYPAMRAVIEDKVLQVVKAKDALILEQEQKTLEETGKLIAKALQEKGPDLKSVPIITPVVKPKLDTSDLGQFYSQAVQQLAKFGTDAEKELAKITAVDRIKQSVDELILRTGTAAGGARVFFRQYAQYANDTAQVVHDAFAKIFSALEDQLTNLLAHFKFDFKSLLDTIKESIARAVVQKFILGPIAAALGLAKNDGSTEAQALWVRMAKNVSPTGKDTSGKGIFGSLLGSVFGGAGGTGTPDGSELNPFHVIDDSNGGLFGSGSSGDTGGDGESTSFLGKIQGQMGKIFSSIGSFFSKIGSAILSAFKFIGGAIGGLFGGGKAVGGDIMPGKFYLVGERGPELIAPRGSGTVIPNHALGGSRTSNNIVNNFYLSPVRSDPFGYSQSQLANAVFTGNMRAMSRA